MLNKTIIGVDTVRFTLPEGSYTVKKTSGFRGSLISKSKTASKEDKAMGLYLPKLILSCPSGSLTLTVEVSLMKALNGDNIQEIPCGQASNCIAVLRQLLEMMGVEVTEENLLNANISRLDIGKNLLCPVGTSAPYILGLLKGNLVSGRKCMATVNYENGGSALRIRTAGTDVLLYDKLRDHEFGGISEKLTLERDHYTQCGIVQEHLENGLEILRLEKRLSKRTSVKRFFKPFGIRFPKLKHILRPDIPQTLVQAEWKQLMAGMVAFPTQNKSCKTALVELLQGKGDMPIKDVFSWLGFQWMLKECSLVEIKRLLTGKKQKAAFPHFKKRMQSFQSGKTPDVQAVFDDLTRQIKNWEAINLPH